MTQTSPQSVAAKLTEAQRKAILCAKNGVIPAYYPTALRISSPTLRALSRLGLVEGWPAKLTPLGEQVRTFLLEQNRG